MISPKLPIKPLEPEKKPRKPRPMTIAIGMLCHGGMVVAADTQVTNSDGTTHDRVKIKSQVSATGTFVIACAGEDMNAAEMLVNDALTDLNLIDPKTLNAVEDLIKDRMAQWSSGFASTNERPYTALVLGARVQGLPSKQDNFGLYHCEPPSLVLRKTMENSRGYVAIGAGLIVSDPLFRTLFGDLVSPRVCLAQISYLMYRAKKDCRGACGGGTNAVLLREDNPAPILMSGGHLLRAEGYGPQLDRELSRVAASILSRNGYDDNSRFKDYFNRKDMRGNFGLYGFIFCGENGEWIREKELQDMMEHPENYLNL